MQKVHVYCSRRANVQRGRQKLPIIQVHNEIIDLTKNNIVDMVQILFNNFRLHRIKIYRANKSRFALCRSK